MSRLTEKNLVEGWDNEYHVTPSLLSPNGMKAIDKLGMLEDVEDELGIELTTLFKALDNGIYLSPWGHKLVDFDFSNKALFYEYERYEDYYERQYFYLKDYGKTWALTKEELEK